MKSNVAISAFEFKRPKPDGPVQVWNDKSYLMAEYNQRTGKVSWQRMVLATEKTKIENWLTQHYPVPSSQPVKPPSSSR